MKGGGAAEIKIIKGFIGAEDCSFLFAPVDANTSFENVDTACKTGDVYIESTGLIFLSLRITFNIILRN